ncbi:FAR1-related sequence 5-like protein [Tanacetum coccineum]
MHHRCSPAFGFHDSGTGFRIKSRRIKGYFSDYTDTKSVDGSTYRVMNAKWLYRSVLVVISFLHSNGYVHDFSTNDVTNELKALFFVHPTSFKIWRAFPHVLMIDATYKTNKYNMPFVEIVGVTSTGKTFCIAFAFISEEKMDNYKWVLECLKLTLDECMLPRVIITDRDLALMNACEKVFPNATRLLCRWHISQNILKNCRQTIKVERDWDSFLSAWKLLEDSPTWISYMENYKQLQLVIHFKKGIAKYTKLSSTPLKRLDLDSSYLIQEIILL